MILHTHNLMTVYLVRASTCLIQCRPLMVPQIIVQPSYWFNLVPFYSTAY